MKLSYMGFFVLRVAPSIPAAHPQLALARIESGLYSKFPTPSSSFLVDQIDHPGMTSISVPGRFIGAVEDEWILFR